MCLLFLSGDIHVLWCASVLVCQGDYRNDDNDDDSDDNDNNDDNDDDDSCSCTYTQH